MIDRMTHDTQAPGLVAKRLRSYAKDIGLRSHKIEDAAKLIERQAARIAAMEHAYETLQGVCRELHAERDTATARAERAEALRAAAQAVVDRWDSPLWGGSALNLRHTGEYIAALRAALTQPEDDGGCNGD